MNQVRCLSKIQFHSSPVQNLERMEDQEVIHFTRGSQTLSFQYWVHTVMALSPNVPIGQLYQHSMRELNKHDLCSMRKEHSVEKAKSKR